MEVIFSNLPSNMSAHEIRRLVSAAILPKGVVEAAKSVVLMNQPIKRLEFKIVTETKSEQLQYCYGVAVIEPERAARSVIRRLSNDVFRGHRFSVREYKNRSYGNDKRNIKWREVHWGHVERRVHDRRKSPQSVSIS